MSEALLQNGLSMSQAFFGMPKLISHVGHVPTAEILELTSLEQIPDPLLGIEFGGIARQAFQMQPFGGPALQKVFDLLGAMDGGPIPDHEQLPGDLAQQETQEAHDICGFIGSLLHLHEEPSLWGQATNGREMIGAELDAQERSLPTRGIGPHGHGQQIKTRLIYKNDGSFFLLSFFFSAGQRSSFQPLMAASSRWLARCTGFCTL